MGKTIVEPEQDYDDLLSFGKYPNMYEIALI